MKQEIIKQILKRAKILLVLLLLATLIAYAGEHFYIFDVISHFRLQYFVISIVFLALFIIINFIKKQPKWLFVICIFLIIVNGLEILPWINFKTAQYNNSRDDIKIALVNVLTSNKNYMSIINTIKVNKPNVIVLQEVNKEWVYKLKELRKAYPYGTDISREDNFGIALYSNIPLQNINTVLWGNYSVPVIVCNVKINNKDVRIASVHTTPPINQDYFENRNYMLSDISFWVKSSKKPAIIIGDLNTSMFSPSYKKLIAESGLKNSRENFGIYPTWSMLLPSFFRIPLDQVLYTKDFKTTNFKTGKPTGSDHLPVLVTFKIK